MDLKYIKPVLSLLSGKQGAIISILLAVLIGAGIYINHQAGKIEKREYELAQAVSDTTKVKLVIHTDSVEVTHYETDTCYIKSIDTLQNVRIDTIKITDYVIKHIKDTGTITFTDDSNDYVSIKGWFKYPLQDVYIEYRAKQLREYRNWQFITGAGWQIDKNRPYLKCDIIYKRVGLGLYAGKDFYGVNFNYRLL